VTEHSDKSQPGNITALIERVNTLLVWERIFKKFYLLLLVLMILLVVCLLVARLTALIPDVFSWQFIAIPFLGALCVALLFYRKVDERLVAQKIDQKFKTNDLFLTAVTIKSAQGEYKQLVLDDANQKAQDISAKDVVCIQWHKPVSVLFGVLIIVLACMVWLPQLDPFGKEKIRNDIARKKDALDKLHKATVQRLKVLKEKPLDKNSPEVLATVDDLKQAFSSMKKNKLKQNLKKLKEMQAQLNKLWKKRHSERLRDLIKQRFAQQSFGRKTVTEEQMEKEYKKGNINQMKRELKKLVDQATKLSKMKDSAEKRKLMKKLRKQVKKMSQFLKNTTKSDRVNAAMKRAMKQMDSACSNPQNKQALQNLADSMKLSKRELEQLAQNLRDIQKLEDAMKALQSANRANQNNSMEGMNDQDFAGLEDYKDYFDKLQKGKGNGKRKGHGAGQGTGMADGSKVDENPDVKTKSRVVKGRGKLQAGKILMKWNVKELSKHGQVKEDYRKEVKKVKQSANEAILKEQVPPGYHESIKRYFNSIKE
jgi:hypothetical protein